MNFSDQINVKRFGVITGLLSVSEVAAWAEGIIQNSENIEELGLFDVAGGGGMTVNDMSSLLWDIGGDPDLEVVLPSFYSELLNITKKSLGDARFAASCLANLSTLLPDKGGLIYFKDSFEDADKGFYGNANDVAKELAEFLENQLNQQLST